MENGSPYDVISGYLKFSHRSLLILGALQHENLFRLCGVYHEKLTQKSMLFGSTTGQTSTDLPYQTLVREWVWISKFCMQGCLYVSTPLGAQQLTIVEEIHKQNSLW
jgi:hypothetical protein